MPTTVYISGPMSRRLRGGTARPPDTPASPSSSFAGRQRRSAVNSVVDSLLLWIHPADQDVTNERRLDTELVADLLQRSALPTARADLCTDLGVSDPLARSRTPQGDFLVDFSLPPLAKPRVDGEQKIDSSIAHDPPNVELFYPQAVRLVRPAYLPHTAPYRNKAQYVTICRVYFCLNGPPVRSAIHHCPFALKQPCTPCGIQIVHRDDYTQHDRPVGVAV